ncbi:MAG: UDP-2,4-diacetamido-2,4,6-trideoxy-beta-L-altropyranose hydrolase [Pseudomonadota bacterium]
MRHVLVRADANSQIGLGHVLRTMAVADELARTGTRITYLCGTVTPWAMTQLRERNFGVEMLDPVPSSDQLQDAHATLRIIERLGIDAVLLDHYGLKGEWTALVKAQSGRFISAFDDLASDARRLDLLIDTSPARRASEYVGLIPEEAICLAGPVYAPLRPEFAMARQAQRPETNARCRVAISMGGVDPSGVTLTCLEALDGRSDVELTVILSSAAQMLEATKERVAQMKTPTCLLLDRTDMASVLKDMDLVIGAGGTSALERCALGLPSVLAVLADNQIFNANSLADADAAVLLPELSEKAVRDTVTPMLADAGFRSGMGERAAQLCDGMGAPRVALAILAHHSGVFLRRAELDDMERVHDWQSEPNARQFARTSQVPTRAEHEAWFHARLAKCDQNPFYIIVVNGVDAGFVRLDQTDEARTAEVSILVPRAAQGQGIARTALGLLRLTHPRRHIVAEVHPENTASQRLFENAGYNRCAAHRFASAGWPETVERQRHED